MQKAVQTALGNSVADPFTELRCADGTLAGCRIAVIASIRATVNELGNNTSTWHADAQGDRIQYSSVGLVGVPDMPWQNRPTFQQVVEATSHR